ncbi:MAG TPA: hypothetical protein VMC80_00250 [Patescibacteria group bacterium]|nr:hypothetical protein [Patescibacteria group bacterium]
MEKNYENLRGLAKEVFGAKKIAKRKNSRGSEYVEVWSKDLISRVIVKVYFKSDIIRADERYMQIAEDFKQRYENEFGVTAALHPF